ncbi:MAG: hypothetical protein AAF399_18350 [Bacteroidota bacterium]
MKRFRLVFTSLIALFFSVSLHAQHGKTETPAFGKITLLNSTMHGQWAIGAGAMGGKYLTPSIFLGGAGYGISNEPTNGGYGLGYGGVVVGYDWKSKEDNNSLVFSLLSGYGGAEATKESGNVSDDFWVIQPNVEVEFKLTNWMRFGVGGGYRFVSGINQVGLTNQELSGPFSSVSLRFGSW